MLLEFGESRKPISLERGDMADFERLVRRTFQIEPDNKIIVQQFDNAWDTWLDINHTDEIMDRTKIKVVVLEMQISKVPAIVFACRILCLLSNNGFCCCH